MLLPAPAASAAPRVVITGGGWGHGIGLSQWGAYQRALDGDSAEQILTHYYTGVRVERPDLPRHVRVGLSQTRSSLSFTSRPATRGGGAVAFKVAGSHNTLIEGKGSTWRVEPSGRGVRLFENGAPVSRDGVQEFARSRPLRLVYAGFGSKVRVAEKDNVYRHGFLEIDSYPGSCSGGHCLRLVAEVPLEQYLLGISEVPPWWPDAAQRVQAIIARTYASYEIAHHGQHEGSCDCALYDSSYDQVYLGDDRRTDSGSYWPNWKRAVTRSEGVAVTYGGSPIQALYMSSSGGHTEDNEDVWGGTPVPYLRGVRDAADSTADNPNHQWRVKLSWADFSARLNAYFSTGSLRRFELLAPFGASGRVSVVRSADRGGARIVGANRTARASGMQVKSALGLKDTLFRVNVIR